MGTSAITERIQELETRALYERFSGKSAAGLKFQHMFDAINSYHIMRVDIPGEEPLTARIPFEDFLLPLEVFSRQHLRPLLRRFNVMENS